jgi:hypothetical protein
MQMLAAACAVVLAGSMLAAAARAETVTKDYTGPNGGSIHYRGDAVPGHYRGAVTVTTPEGKTFRRVTKAHKGDNGAVVSRRWVGPNGAVVRRGAVRY